MLVDDAFSFPVGHSSVQFESKLREDLIQPSEACLQDLQEHLAEFQHVYTKSHNDQLGVQ